MTAKLRRRVKGVNARAVPRTPSASPRRTAAGDAFSALVVQLFRVHGLLSSAGDALARPAGQTSARWQVLASVEDAPATVAAIARTFGLARQSVQRVANLLVRDGLAGFAPNPANRRADLLQLTPRGRSTLRTIQRAQRAWANSLGAELGVTALRDVGEQLRRVRDALARRADKD
jgi:DNA-binding MarR family transcriptional regulator